MSYRDAFRPCSRLSSGEKNNTYSNMQRYETSTKNLEVNIGRNLESLNFQTCNDTKLRLPNLVKVLVGFACNIVIFSSKQRLHLIVPF